mgnify:CR=1 FL=1|jgi:hypothetical protein
MEERPLYGHKLATRQTGKRSVCLKNEAYVDNGMIQQHCIHSSTFSSLIPQTTHSNTTPSSLIFLHNEPKSPLLVRKQRERVILEVSHHTSGVVKPCIQRDSTLRFYSKRPSLCITRQLEFGVFGLKSKKINKSVRMITNSMPPAPARLAVWFPRWLSPKVPNMHSPTAQ